MHIDIILDIAHNMLGVNAQFWQVRLHSQIALELSKNGWQQDQIANVLGTTQSTISRWKEKPTVELSSVGDNQGIDNIAIFLSSQLSKKGVPKNISFEISIGEEKEQISLSMIGQGSNSVNNHLINSMSRMIRLFSKLPEELIPAVGINIAACSKNVKENSEVLAFPGRLRLSKGKVLQQVPPQIGASKHLSEVLMSLRSKGSNASVIINLKLPNNIIIRDLSNKLGLEISDAPKGKPGKNANILIDRGDFGWEPSLYLASDTVEDLPKMVNQLISICQT